MAFGVVGLVAVLWPDKSVPEASPPAFKHSVSFYRPRQPHATVPWQRAGVGQSRVLSISGMRFLSSVELQEATFGTAWGLEKKPELAAFSSWAKIYVDTTDQRARRTMKSKGVALAAKRREAMGELIKQNPQAAIAATVPAMVRRQLPETIQAHLETRVSAMGSISVQAALPDGSQPVRRSLFRTAMVEGQEYRAHVYGERGSHRTRVGIPLQGIAVGRDLAVLDSPGRVLESAEIVLPARAFDRQCTVCNNDVARSSQPVATEQAGRVLWQCCPDHAIQALGSTSQSFKGRRGMLTLADRSRKVGDFSVTDRPRMAWTYGAKRVLLIRVDFADITGMPVSRGRYVTQDYAWTLFQRINKFFQRASYGCTSVLLDKDSITPVLRMPQSALFYARGGLNDTLHLHARQAAAAAGFDVETYDRVGVVFSSLKWYGGTQMDYGGLANVEGRNFWVNGCLEFGSVAHELGHTYGVHHANLHRSSNRSPIGPGTTVEYGDIFDIMGNTTLATEHHDFNPWFKYLLHWLPEQCVLTATGPGVYRVYRFDKEAPGFDQPLVLKVRRRNEDSNYWIGYRRAFPQLSRAAYVMWGFEENRNSELLDMRTPWINPMDAGLLVGQAFHDQAAAVTLHPLEAGTDEVGRSYLDIEVKMIEAPVITGQPQEHQKIEPGGVLRLTVWARSKGSLRHEWRRDGKVLKDDGRVVGARSAELTVLNLSAADAGRYTAHLIYEGGEVASRVALVDVGTAALEPRVDWLRRLGGTTGGSSHARALAADPSGDLLLAGEFSGSLNLGGDKWTARGPADMFLVRYNSQGKIQWTTVVGGEFEKSVTSMLVDATGNVHLVGWFFERAKFGPHTLLRPGRYTAFVAKADAAGSWQWARALADEGESMCSGLGLLSNGDLVVCGAFRGVLRAGTVALASRGCSDAFVMCLNSSGRMKWAQSMGGPGEDVASGVAVLCNGQIVVAGNYSGTATFGPHRLSALGETDVFVTRWTSSGQLEWLTSEGGRGSDFASNLAATREGGLLLAGDFEGVATLGQVNHQSHGATDVFLVKYHKDGVPAWSRVLGGLAPDIGGQIAVGRNGVIHLISTTGGQVRMEDQMLVGRGGMDVCLASYALDGTLLGGRTWGGGQDELSAGLVVDALGNVILSGSASGHARFDTFTLEASGLAESFLLGIQVR